MLLDWKDCKMTIYDETLHTGISSMTLAPIRVDRQPCYQGWSDVEILGTLSEGEGSVKLVFYKTRG